MSSDKIKQHKLEDILARVAEYQANSITTFELYQRVAKIVLPFEGKEITKRIHTAVKKALPEYTVTWDDQYGMYQLRIWGNGIEYDKRRTFMIGYRNQPCFQYGEREGSNCFLDSNKSFALEPGRNAELEAARVKIPGWVERWNKAVAELEAISKEVGHDLYPLSSLLRI